MTAAWPPGIFVVGTDTGVGKTRVAAALARSWMQLGRRVGVVKPVSTGGIADDGGLRSPDVDALLAAITAEGSPFPPPPYDRAGPLIFEAPLAPPIAARRAGVALEPAAVVAATEGALGWWADEARADLVVVEGVGGLLCPIALGGYTVADLASHLDYPILIVAHRGLGTLNHTLLTVEVARNRGLRIVGIALNAARPAADPLAEASNAAELAALVPTVPILADWPFDPAADPVPIAPAAGNWVDRAQRPRPAAARPRGAGPYLSGTSLLAPSLLVDSDDDLVPDPISAGLIGTTTTSATMAVDAPSGSAATTFSSLTALAGLDFGPRSTAAAPRLDSSTGSAGWDDPPRSSWGNLLLASYASAVSLALAWTWYQHRGDRRMIPPVAPTAMVAESLPVEGRLDGRSKRVEILRPIADDHLIPLGQARQFDSLRVEPIAIGRQDLTLERINMAGKTERRTGDRRTIILRLRLMNRSADQVFAPLDPAFVRGRPDGAADTLLELDDGRKVYPGSLAVDSEWVAVGENFGDLRPGESREVIFTTAANAPPDAENRPATWRIKLRTGVGTSDVVGIRLPGKEKP